MRRARDEGVWKKSPALGSFTDPVRIAAARYPRGMETRDVVAAAARALVGLTAPSEELGMLVDPGGDPAHELAVEQESLCMLVAFGLWRRVFDLPPSLSGADRPNVNGSVPRLLGGVLDAAGARRVPTLEAPPGMGDGLWYAAHGAYPEHVDACVVMATPAGRYPTTERAGEQLLSVVAGGERDGAGHETVRLLARTLCWSGSAWVCQATGRSVRWALDPDLLAARFGLRGE
jgi:hypothetical protein